MRSRLGLLAVALVLFWGAPLFAQGTAVASQETMVASEEGSASGPTPAVGLDSEAAAQPTATAAPAASGTAQAGTAAPDDGWHFAVSPYLWLPWVHGNVGALDREVHFSVTPGELLSNFRFGLMGSFEPRYKRLLLPVDMVWARIGDDKALPFPDLEATSANLTANLFILTSKVGARLIDQEKYKADVLVGVRYWYFGETVNFSPSSLNFSRSQSWVDPVVGGRIEAALSPKVVVNILGDVGGWGTGSQLEYQVGGFLGYKIKPNLTLQTGYRFLTFNYLRNAGIVGPTRLNLTMSGIVLGATFAIK
jgi:hypothetical protein